MDRVRISNELMNKRRILHICNWYPNIIAPNEAPFVERHIRSLAPYCENEVWHIEVRKISQSKRCTRESLKANRTFLVFLRTRHWIIREWCTTLLVLWAWYTRNRSSKFDLVNIHIAYPLALHAGILKRMFNIPIVLTEHWSAYHYSFNSKSKGLDRIRSIFCHDIPLIGVSRALIRDIEQFSRRSQERAFQLDNAIDSKHYTFVVGSKPEEGRFFALAGWRAPKRPEVLIKAIFHLNKNGFNVNFRIGGDGPLISEMQKTVNELNLQGSIEFLGRLTPIEAADEMRNAHLFLHCSDYETYSAVCAEALCCGTPVIASKVGGIVEYMTKDTGFLVDQNDPYVWASVIQAIWHRTLVWDRSRISKYMMQRSSDKYVGQRYFEILERVVGDEKFFTRTDN